MVPDGGCLFTHVAKEDKQPVKRIFVGEGDDWSSPLCHDCGAGEGQPHHPGCDAERCPVCGQQMMMCLGPEEDTYCGWVYLQTRA
jgi:hypothetical protein